MQQYCESVRELVFGDWMWIQTMKHESILLNLSTKEKKSKLVITFPCLFNSDKMKYDKN